MVVTTCRKKFGTRQVLDMLIKQSRSLPLPLSSHCFWGVNLFNISIDIPPYGRAGPEEDLAKIQLQR